MAIRLPLTTIFDYNQTTENGAGVAGVNASVAGGQANAFLLPQDCDNIVVKFTASIAGAGASAVFQTSDDGGTTWYDVARTSVVSNANATTAEWLSVPVIGAGMGTVTTSVVATGSVQSFGGTTGTAAASTLGQKTFSGLPILGRDARIFVRYAAGITSVIAMRATVSANSQATSAN